MLNNQLKSSSVGPLLWTAKKHVFCKKLLYLCLKVPLFVEKAQNKFAHDFKKNKFVFN
jgi:hypothetical protein